jgi:mevalonate kinase
MSTDKKISHSSLRLDELKCLLEKQIELARQGNISEIDVLIEQAGSLVGKIVRPEILESAEFQSQREQLQKLYYDLCLALTAQQAETTKELSRVHKGKKTIETYRNNI